MTTVSYYRNSIDEKKQKLSIEMQVRSVKEKAQSLKLLIDEEYTDRATSARKNKTHLRKNMGLLMGKIQKGHVKNLLVYSRCRLARNVNDYMNLYGLLKQKKVNVIFTAEYEFPMLYTAESELIERIIAAFNQQEAEKLVYKLQDAKVTKAKDGKHAVGAIPYGYRKGERDGDDWKPDEEESQTVINLFRFFVELEFKSISEFLVLIKNRGLTYKNGNDWNYNNIRSLLEKPVYKGERVYKDKGIPIVRVVEGIKLVEVDVWEKTQQKLKVIIRQSPAPDNRKTNVTYLLNGLISCAECGKEVKGKKYNNEHSYKCNKHHRHRVQKDFLEMEIMNKANHFFLEMITTYMGNVVDRLIQDEVKFYESAIEKFEKEANQAKTYLIQKGQSLMGSSMKEFLDEKIYYQLKNFEEKQYLKHEMESRIFDIHERYGDLEKVKSDIEPVILTHELENEKKMELLHDIVYKITLYQGKVDVVFKHPFKESILGSGEIEFS
ncbi:recombinase family protein [Guptibacillus hwajinpoensis]|uniref:recombinase family protein n=1 Tax=Guptibacillus hwajinpoensis TaxID=208199 RepID=UPI001CFE547E|nr:recombinase family protein [Pseudalkalibacillus hwajinpoensis]WLR60632.1 recombinase family protein [Pseudalkalibacillus hwajinpoensis]